MTAKANRKNRGFKGGTINSGLTDDQLDELVKDVLAMRAQFATESEIKHVLRKRGFKSVEADRIFDVVRKTYEIMSTNYQQELFEQVRLTARQTAQQIDGLLSAATTTVEKASVLQLKMRNTELVRKLLPAQIEVSQTGNINKAIFDMFGIEVKDDEAAEDEK